MGSHGVYHVEVLRRRQGLIKGFYVSHAGFVYGDCGTSLLYAFKEAFRERDLPLAEANVLAMLLMIFWSNMQSVSHNYVTMVLR